MNITQRKSIFDDLKKYCHISKDNDFIEITEWTNGEGWDINISSNNNDILFSLTYGQLEAINYLTKCLEFK